MKNTLILVSGLPGTGKTTLAKKISEEFKIPAVGMDGIKETIWNSVGYEFDLDSCQKISRASFDLVFYFIKASLSEGKPMVAEAHFSPELSNEETNALKEKYGANIVQIYCDCETETLRKRFKDRMENSKNYHAGHKHTISLHGEERIMDSLGKKNKRLDIDGKTYDLDTTDFEKIDYEKLFRFIKSNF